MTYRQDEVAVSRSALRDAIHDDLLVALKAAEVTADPSFDGAPVVTIPALNEALGEVFGVPLPPPSDKHAEVTTPATIVVHAICPECGISAKTVVYLSSRLVVETGTGELNVKAASKARTHVHGQRELDEPVPDQVTIDDVLAGQPDDAPTEDVPTETTDQAPEEVCPYPGCARAPEHRGLHRDAEGKKVDGMTDEGTTTGEDQ